MNDSHDGEAPYADASAATLTMRCQTCHGRGYVQRPFTSAVPGVMACTHAQRTPCPDCRVSPAGSSGTFNLQAGPGARRLRHVDRVTLPGDLASTD